MANRMQLWLAKWAFSSKRANFYADLAEALNDRGVLVDIIRTVERRALTRGDIIAPIYTLWLRRMDDRPFSLALADTVPDTDVMILSAAETSNNLSGGLMFLSKAIVAAEAMLSGLKKAVAGPVFLMVMFTAMIAGFSFYVVPVFTQIMKPSTWPMIGQALYAVSSFVTNYGYWLLGSIVVLGSAYVWSLPRWVGGWRSKVDRYVPLYSIYRDFVGSIFLVSLASLMQSGMGLSESLTALSSRGTPWLRWHILRIQARLDFHADQPAQAFATGIFNQTLTDRVLDYGARSAFHDAIGKVGLASVDKVAAFVNGSATILNQALLLLCGATLIFMISGVMLTAQEAQNVIQRQVFVK